MFKGRMNRNNKGDECLNEQVRKDIMRVAGPDAVRQFNKVLSICPPYQLNYDYYRLSGMFVWDTTPQGHQYWADIMYKIDPNW